MDNFLYIHIQTGPLFTNNEFKALHIYILLKISRPYTTTIIDQIRCNRNHLSSQYNTTYMYIDILAFIYYYFNTKITSLVIIPLKAVYLNVFIMVNITGVVFSLILTATIRGSGPAPGVWTHN